MADNEPTTPPPVRRSMTTPPPAPRKTRPVNETTETETPSRSRRRLFAVSDESTNIEIEIPQFSVLVFRRHRKTQIGVRKNNHTLF